MYDRAYLESDKVKLFLKVTYRSYREKLVVILEDWDSPTGLVTCWDQLKEACYQMIKRAEICNDLSIIGGVKTSALYPQVSHDGKLYLLIRMCQMI